MRVGVHCVLYGEKIVSDTQGVLKKLAKSGAAGCEVGQRFFGTDNQEILKKALEENHLELSAMHCGNVYLTDFLYKPEMCRESIASVAKFVTSLDCRNVVVTGRTDFQKALPYPISAGVMEPELHDRDNIKKMAENFQEIVKEVKASYDVEISYHNHSWEFMDNAAIWNALIECAPDLNLALDVGWAAVSGYDPVKLIKENKDRIHYVHFRDYKKKENPQARTLDDVHSGFVDLGTGDMDYPALIKLLNQELREDDWAVIEYEIGNFNEYSYVGAARYVTGMLDMLRSF